jgi:hypothetical protein
MNKNMASFKDHLTFENLPDAMVYLLSEVSDIKDLLRIRFKDETPKYRTRNEVCKAYKISLPTLNTYTKKGIIKGVKVGNRVLYSDEAIQEALKDATSLKYRRVQ